ncbi:unnamed protein product [Eruca vesicaria subsp. sativa]|uniref:Uncharacterized protein n=1 Tax=Eruca vesicaria subsp. sativa TaxID=29727 RepID=A0ABC8KI18_ERUVS|nr:unnamed protein product [Eruca vesicaria subsp. sativa]
MPSGAKKRKAAKKKQEQASSTQINLKSNNHAQTGSTEKETVKDTDERIEITDSSHDHDKSSSNNSSSSSSDDESQEVKSKDGDKEETEVVVTVVPSQPVPVAGGAPFIGSTANVIVENTGLMDSTTDPNTENIIEISSVDAIVSNEPAAEVSLASDEIKQASPGTTGSDKKESKCVPEGSKESEVVISHEEEAHVIPTHGVAQRTSWLSCCGLFDVMSGSSR